jgi:hypothetical protein
MRQVIEQTTDPRKTIWHRALVRVIRSAHQGPGSRYVIALAYPHDIRAHAPTELRAATRAENGCLQDEPFCMFWMLASSRPMAVRVDSQPTVWAEPAVMMRRNRGNRRRAPAGTPGRRLTKTCTGHAAAGSAAMPPPSDEAARGPTG